MEGLIYFLLLGGLFYFMMRFGCGSHMVHGHGGHDGHAQHGHNEHSTQPDDAGSHDTVCGMLVPPDREYTKMHSGVRYHFCSRACLGKFEAEPDKYTDKARRPS
jgi:YHS domain-containing protein